MKCNAMRASEVLIANKNAFVLVICFILLPTAFVSAQIPLSERNALIALYGSTGGEDWKIQEGWLGAPGTETDWYGVQVQDGHVVNITLRANGLIGKLPPEIGDFPELLWLDLSGYAAWIIGRNDLEGPVPPQLGQLAKLEFLDLSSNDFSGPAPAELGNLAQLVRLDLRRNALTSLPPTIGLLVELRNLDLTGNFLSQLPGEIGDLSKLEELRLADNQLQILPDELGQLTQLQSLSLVGNPFTQLPSTLGNLTQLKTLWIGGTELLQIPEELGLVQSLETVDISRGTYSSLPKGIGHFRFIQKLDASDNELLDLPAELANLRALKELDLSGNRLATLPAVLGEMVNLELLHLRSNPLRGPIPAYVGQLTQLKVLKLDAGLSGAIPPELGNMTELRELVLSSRHLTGEIPVELARLDNLELLAVSGTGLTGSIPPELGLMTNLRQLALNSNRLSGRIPAELGGLSEVYLRSNELSGQIPPELGGVDRLDLSENQLSGEIPPELGQVDWLDLSENRLSGKIPPELFAIGETLNLSFNRLEGKIPEVPFGPDRADHNIPRVINLSENRLSGSIPNSLMRMTSDVLDLSSNALTGPIPPDVGHGRFRDLRLDANQLSGPLPESLVSLASVYLHLVLEWNALSSPSPRMDQFLERYNGSPNPFLLTQTLPALDLEVARVTGSTVTLKWTAIEFFFFEGGYEVYYSSNPEGPYQLSGRTERKSTRSMTVTGLDSDTAYYFVLKTVSESHVYNPNIVNSELSQQVSATTSSAAEVYFPLLLSGAQNLTGLALASESDVGLSLRFEPFDASGRSLLASPNPIEEVLLPRSQAARLSRDLLNFASTPATMGWIKVTADDSRFGGSFLMGTPGSLDGGAAFGATAKQIYFTRVLDGSAVFRGQTASALLSIVNPNPRPVRVGLTYTPPSTINVLGNSEGTGETLTRDHAIPANGMLLKSPKELFDQDLSGGYIDVEVTSGGVGVVGFELIQFPQSDAWLALPAQPQMQSRNLYSAQVALGQEIFTSVQLVNTARHARAVTISFIKDATSTPDRALTFNLSENACLSLDLQDILELDEAPAILPGFLRVEADRPGLLGDVVFGDRQDLRYAAGLALQGPGIQSGLFSHVVNTPGIYTALALYNPGPDPAEVQLQTFSTSGLLTGNAQVILPPGGRISQTLSSLVPETRNQSGSLRLESTVPIAVQQLFGTADLKWLSATHPSRIRGAEVQLR